MRVLRVVAQLNQLLIYTKISLLQLFDFIICHFETLLQFNILFMLSDVFDLTHIEIICLLLLEYNQCLFHLFNMLVLGVDKIVQALHLFLQVIDVLVLHLIPANLLRYQSEVSA